MQSICVCFRLYPKFQEYFFVSLHGFQKNSVDLILQIVLMFRKTVYIYNDDGIDIPINWREVDGARPGGRHFCR